MSSHSHGREPFDQQFTVERPEFAEVAEQNQGPTEAEKETDQAAHRYLRAFETFSNITELRYAADTEDDGYAPDTLRVGIDSAHMEIGALLKVLLARGVLDKREYYATLAETVEAERDEQLRRLGLLVG